MRRAETWGHLLGTKHLNNCREQGVFMKDSLHIASSINDSLKYHRQYLATARHFVVFAHNLSEYLNCLRT